MRPGVPIGISGPFLNVQSAVSDWSQIEIAEQSDPNGLAQLYKPQNLTR